MTELEIVEQESDQVPVDTLERDESDLACRRCLPPGPGDKPLGEHDIQKHLQKVDLWWHQSGEIAKTFTFQDARETFAFVCAVHWISERQGHYPEIRFGPTHCRVGYASPEIGGISENDFICAAKVDRLLKA